MSYIFWKLLFQRLILAINEDFLSIIRGIRILLTHCNRIEHKIWHLVILTIYLQISTNIDTAVLSPPTWPWRTISLQPPWPSPPSSWAFESCWDKIKIHLPVVDAPDPRGLVGQTIRTTCIYKTTAHEHGDYDPIHHNLQKCIWSLSYCRSLTRPTSINCWTGSTFRHRWQLALTRSSAAAEGLS